MTSPPLGAPAPTALADTRVELHWLAQVLGAVGDAFLPRADDDSQSNLHWSADHEALVGRPIGDGARCALLVARAELAIVEADGHLGNRLDARGHSVAELLTWAGAATQEAAGVSPKAPPVNRDYYMF